MYLAEKRSLIFATFVLALIGLARESAAQVLPCNFVNIGGNCTTCQGLSRAYYNYGGVCVLCLRFCLPSSGEVDPALEKVNRAIASTEELLFISADAALISDMANINPDAAAQLYVLTVAAKTPGALIPMRGDAGATVLFTAGAVMEMMQEDATTESHLSKTRPISHEGWWSKILFDVVKQREGKGLLSLRHRLVDKAGAEMQTLHPDITVELKWVPTGRAGYWKAVNWSHKDW